MRVTILIACLLLGNGVCALAQTQIKIEHLSGPKQMGSNSVTVINEKGASNTTYNNVNPYHIGKKGHINGYTFIFAAPVRRIKVDLSAINDGEKIEIGINGKKYKITSSNIQSYIGKFAESTMAKSEDGIITVTGKYVMASATVDIAVDYDINSVYVRHLNGLAGGTIFSLSFEDNTKLLNTSINQSNPSIKTTVPASTFASGGVNKLMLYPNPTTGSFILKGDVQTMQQLQIEIVNAVGQKIYEKSVLPVQNAIHETLELNAAIVNGLYTVRISDNKYTESLSFTLSR